MKANRLILPFTLLFLATFFIQHIQAQVNALAGKTETKYHWYDLMQDPNSKFQDVQNAFYSYWNNHQVVEERKSERDEEEAGENELYEGNGYYIFKRWEYINESRVLPDGKLQSFGFVKDQYEKYMSEIDASTSTSGNWALQGPIAYPVNNTGQPTGMGRINAIAFHPTDANTIYIGAPSGGFWKTTDAGTTWTNLASNLPKLGVSSILVNPVNPNIIYIGTGDRDAGDAPGIGVFKSIDGGTSWNQLSNTMGNVVVGAMVMHPSDPNTIIAATSAGIYKTTDGGSTWVLKSSNTSNYKDIKFNSGDPTVVYATEGGRFYRSSNTGESWTQISAANGVPSAGSRMVIGITPANSSYVYLVQIKSTDNTFGGILRSTDNGQNFTIQSSSPNIFDYSCDGSGTSTQSTYDLCVTVDPNNANIVYVGSINNWKSSNGGVTWTITSHWVGNSYGTSCAASVHADQHCYGWSPLNGKLYVGCDGGIYWTSNGGTNWTQISGGLSISQVYKLGQSATNPNYTLVGFQDNGSAATLNSSSFYTTRGGDGTECLIDYSNTNYCYNTYVQGAISRSSGGPTGSYSNIASTGTNGISIDESGSWVTPYMLHRTNPSIMFAGYENVFRCDNVKATPSSSVSWTAISSGETSVCKVLEQSAADVNVLYVVRSGAMKRSDNATAAAASVTWTSCALPGGSTPTDVKAHPTDANIVYATAGYKIYKSIDKGASWTDISGNLPSLFINCLVYDKNTNEGIYIGNQTGVWFKNSAMPYWVLFSNGLPPVDVREMEIYYDATPANSKIKAATYGRGLWQSDLINVNVIDPSNLIASSAGPTQINLTWTKNVNDDNVMVAVSASPVFGSPMDGTIYTAGNTLAGGGLIIFNGNASSFNHSLLSPATTYYYKIWSVNGSNQYSAGVSTNETTDCNPFSLPFVENFSTTSLPGCWKIKDYVGNGQVWKFGTISGPTLNGSYAYLNSDGYGSGNTQNSDLITPTINCSGYSSVVLQFNHYFMQYSNSAGKVYYSIDNGSTWVLLQTYTSTTANPASAVFVINAAGGQSQVKFKWNYTGSWEYYWAIDDVQVTDCQGFWTGTTNTDWHTASNWCSNAIPSATTNVLIPTGVTNMPYISSVTIANCKDITIQSGATLKMASGTELDVKGNWVCNGGFDYSNSGTTALVKFNGSVQQFVGGSSNTLLKKLAIDNPSGILCTASGKQFRADNIFLTNGVVTTGTNTVYVFGGSLTRTNGYVNGNLAKYIWTNASAVSNITYEVGDAMVYAPVNLNFPTGSITSANSLTIKTVPGDHPSVSASSLNPYRSVNRYWSITNGGAVFSALNAIFNFTAGDLDASTTPASLVAGRYSASVWSYPVIGTRTSTSTQITGLSSSGLGEFQLAETCMNPDLPTIAVTKNPICAGESTVLSISSGNLNSATNWLWYSGSCGGTFVGSGTSITVSPLSTTAYYVRGEGGCISPGSCATSALATIAVNPVIPASINIVESDNQVCAGTVITFTSTAVNGGVSPSYQWKVNNVATGTNSSSFSYTPIDNDIVTCILTSNLACASGNPAISNAVTMHVNPVQDVSIGISATATQVCSGTEVTFASAAINGGTSPSYQWQVNGSNTGTGTSTFTYIPLNGDVVSCILTSNISCANGSPASSNYIAMQVSPVSEVSVGITVSANQVCDGAMVTFTANAVNGGPTPAYQWQVNGINSGTGSSGFTYMPADGDVVRCVLSSSIICSNGSPAISNAISMQVNPLQVVSVGVSASASEVCAGTEVTFIATPINGGETPSFAWQVNGLEVASGTSTYSYVPANSDVVKCFLTSSVSCASSNPAESNSITLAVNPVSAVGISISASSNPVASGNVVTFSAVPENGGNNPTYLWQVNGLPVGDNSDLYAYIPADNDQVNCILTSSALCSQGNPASSNLLTMVVQSGKALNLKVLLQGLYSGNGIMNKARGEAGDQFTGNIADKVNVELHESLAPFSLAYTFSNLNLSTDGAITANIPQSVEGSYYIVVRHRNSIETWSANPLYFSSNGIVNFDFTTSVSQAYGNNLRVTGLYSLIYGGDVNQDGVVDGSDMAMVENASTAILRGYFDTDVNGDGQVDSSDMALVDNNSTGIIQVIKP
ncbi:MAG: hypothetical protein HXX13_10065 [Bacteroidetes bacterium]|nr:hypothetical protein [Bacteroidota bacterium]